ncbi:MAG: GTPase HflX [Stomatobaculum sp.]|nr:GTPase HflX [Stomatobaculum sp.]
MEQMFSTEECAERVIVIGVRRSERDGTEESLRELSELLDTAGAETVGQMIQNRDRPDQAAYFGKGKIEELKELIFETEATGVAADDELSPAQMKNLKDALDVKIMDRTMIILDIFAKHAVTAEGKIQVELAQLKYSAAHLEGLRSSLSRLGGGIGTRGPGEQKLELDRRVIHERISFLKERLREIERHREVTRKARERSGSFVVSIVGYTNAGKSTLLNRLTDAGILAEDQLFATLDPTTRRLTLPGGDEILLTDTVGFIRKLPHHLIEAFRSTLEEAKYSDLILHVVDAGNPEADLQMAVVYRTLEDLGALQDKDVVTVFNKMDTAGDAVLPRDFHAARTVRISALTGEGIGELKEVLREERSRKRRYLEKLFSYQEAGQIQLIRQKGQLISEEYTENGILVKAMIPGDLWGRLTGK